MHRNLFVVTHCKALHPRVRILSLRVQHPTCWEVQFATGSNGK